MVLVELQTELLLLLLQVINVNSFHICATVNLLIKTLKAKYVTLPNRLYFAMLHTEWRYLDAWLLINASRT